MSQDEINKIYHINKRFEKLGEEFQSLERQYEFFETNVRKNIMAFGNTVTGLTSQMTKLKDVELVGYQGRVESYVSGFNYRIKKQNILIKDLDVGVIRCRSDLTVLAIRVGAIETLKHLNSNSNIITNFDARVKKVENSNNILDARVGNIETLKYSNLIYELDARVKKFEKLNFYDLDARVKKIENLNFYDLEARIVFMEKVIVFMKQQNTKILNK